MVDRNYVLDLMKSRDMTIEDFNYDKLTCPPLMTFFSAYDIAKLKEIATSLRYSAKPQAKYKEIDKIMNSRGFVKLVAGTNRICYRCVEDDTFVVKVAYDKVGMNDNPREFVNQNYLKPFCTKVFEVAGDGIIASFERVKPILSREEFISIAKDVFTLLDEFVMGEYVLDDCGTKYYMNYGLRKGFGPVLLDFTYLYKLDGRKLFCNRPDKNSETGYCLGEIDSSPGFNEFVCKKCGAIYRAADLAAEIENNNVIIKNKGEYNKMKVTLKGGTNNMNTAATTTKVEEVIPDVKSIPTNTSSTKEVSESGAKIKVSLGGSKIIPANVNIGNEGITGSISVKTKKAEKVEEKKVVNNTTEDKKKDTNTSSKKQEKKIQPIHFTKEEKSHIEIIKESIENIKKAYAYLIEDEKDVCDDIIKEFIDDMNKKISNDDTTVTKIENMSDEEVLNLYNSLIKLDTSIELSTEATEENTTKVIADVYTNVININSGNVIISDKFLASNGCILDNNITNDQYEEYIIDETSNNDSEDEYYVEDEDANTDEYIQPYAGVKYFEAETIDISNIFTGLASKSVITIIDKDSNKYFTTSDNNIIAIDRVNNIDTSEATIVSSRILEVISPEKNNAEKQVNDEVEVTVNGVPAATK